MTTSSQRYFFIVFTLSYLGWHPTSSAADFPSLFDFISEQSANEVIIRTDLKELFRKKDAYQEAQITILAEGDTILNYEGEIRTRGHARKDICSLPPTKIRFNKSFLTRQNLSTYPTLKLVGACSLSDRDRDYVVAEQLIYQINNNLTEHSFRTQAIHIHYVDAKNKKKPIKLSGFLIEHEDEMAARLKSRIYETFFNKEILDRRAYLDFSVFQYMIGNTDWKVMNHHNLRVIINTIKKRAYPIAYDFDYSGLIKADYAVPHSSLDLTNVTERLYLGPCQTKEEIEITRSKFLQKEQEITDLLEGVNLGKHQYNYSQKYLTEFFNILRNEKYAHRVFSQCRDW